MNFYTLRTFFWFSILRALDRDKGDFEREEIKEKKKGERKEKVWEKKEIWGKNGVKEG